jgi:immunity protein, SdpI family
VPGRTTGWLRWRTEAPQLALIAGMFIATAIFWDRVPDRVPVHWNVAGQVDRYGGKVEGLLVVPALSLGLYLLLAFIPRLDPRRAAYPRFAGSYAVIRSAIVGFLAATHVAMLYAATGQPVDINRVIGSLMGLLFITLGFTVGRVQPNWFVGVRTPWTLSSPTVWTKTHRAAGWTFRAAGAVLLLGGVLGSIAMLVGGIAVLLVGVGGLVVYSYVVWRTAPDKSP